MKTNQAILLSSVDPMLPGALLVIASLPLAFPKLGVPPSLCLSLLLTALAIAKRSLPTILLGSFFIPAHVLAYWFSELGFWPLHFLLPLAVSLLLLVLYQPLRRRFNWVRAGSFSAPIPRLVAFTAAFSLIALWGWVLLFKPSLSQSESLSRLPLFLLPVSAVAFASVNAALEEGVFRGLIYESLSGAFQHPFAPIVGQAVVFGAFHYSFASIPSGVAGVALTLVFGLVLGALRYVSGGLFAAWVVHVIADLGVFVAILLS